ncbi:MAG: M28 family peptidase [Actinobacteria bacterium]|nr:M28 family peptidase [Actinomycetota bacterium]
MAFEPRAPGSDAERRAARHLKERLEALGRDAEIEPMEVRARYELVHLVHVLAAIAGSILLVVSPLAGTILLLITAVSLYLDLTASFELVRRLTPRRASQNVISREDGGRPGTLVLVAHYDAGRTGAPFGRRLSEVRARIGTRIRRPIGAFEAVWWSVAVLLACGVLRLIGISITPVVVVQFVATVVLIVAVPLIADIAFSGTVPGANDNASGVATALRLAERYGDDLDHFDLWVLLTGAGEGPLLGMRNWVRSNRRSLDAARTAFVCIDEVGAGTVRYVSKEGFALAYPFHPALIDCCRQIEQEDEAENRYGARSLVSRSASDAFVARRAGFPAVTITSRNALDYVPRHHLPADAPDRIDADSLDRAYRFCSELIELIDERIGPDLERDEAAGFEEDYS